MRWGSAQKFVVILSVVAGLTLAPLPMEGVSASPESDHPIAAANAVVIDADTGRVLYDHHMDEQVHPASLTKIFTSIVALESSAVDRELKVDAYDQVGEASIGLHAGEELQLETLLFGVMLTSGNDAAMTIARELGYLPGDSPQESVSRFVERVNATAARLGLNGTQMRNPHGLDQRDHVSTAADIAAMTMYALGNPVFQELIATPYHAADGREFYNMNRLLDSYPGLVGGKTGVTSQAGYCLMQVAQRDGKTVIVVLLGSTSEQWYADAEYLLDLGFDRINGDDDDEQAPVLGLAADASFDVPEVAGDVAVGGNLTVDRLNDHEAVVRSSGPTSEEEAMTWLWPLISVMMMGVALVLVLNFSTVLGLGALALDRGSRIRVTPRGLSLLSAGQSLLAGAGRMFSRSKRSNNRTVSRNRERSASPETEQQWHTRSGTPTSGHLAGNPVSVSPAQARAEKAIQLAMQSRYHRATEEFRHALEMDSNVDLTRCPGFWRMQPMGYISAAKAYTLVERRRDARRLLTIVQLAFKSNSKLVGLFGRAIKALDD